jgi:phage RecT family recombinase
MNQSRAVATRSPAGVATVEPAAVPYPLQSPIAAMLRSPEALQIIQPLIPKGVDFEEVLIEVYRAYTVNNEIARCTAQSVALAVATVVQLGLQIGRTVHLVPVNTKVSKRNEPERHELRLNAWTDYKGDVELVLRSGAARHVDAHAVYSGEFFDYGLGDAPFVRHRPKLDTEKRGTLIAAYSVAYLNGAGTLKKITVMSLAEIETVRAGSKLCNPGRLPICPEWYALKTVIHRNCKMLPKNPRLAHVLALFDHQQAVDHGEPAIRSDAPSTSFSDTAGREPESTTTEQLDRAPVREPAACESFRMPFGQSTVGKPLKEISSADLTSGRAWAMRNHKFPEFVEAATDLLEMRRLREADEPDEPA